LAFLRGHWQLLCLVAAIFALWSTPLVTPLKILVVYFHELSHALAALLTGGSVERINVSPAQGGFAEIRGGNRFATLTAGYLGSLLLGVVLLLLALRSRWDRVVMGLLGAVTLLVTALYMRDLYTIGFGIVTGGLMLATAWWLPRALNDLVLRVIGVTSMIYVPYDIFDDTIRRSGLRSDARLLAEEIGGTTVIWGGIWLVIAMVVIVASFRWGLGPDSNIKLGRTKQR
jgi:hypothetical protein